MHRRQVLKAGVITAATAATRGWTAFAQSNRDVLQPAFSTQNIDWQRAYDHALNVLANNVQVLPRFAGPVLIEGAEYAGIWQECAPQEALVYRHFRPDAARSNHLTFFQLQKPDGQLPANNKRSETGFGQLQMVVPIAATAWELAEATGDDELLRRAYKSCSSWDAWLMRYRNTRGTGLIEGFCTYDTGMDNSPRWKGMARQCPNKDARQCPPDRTLPRLCPDLSATVYGARLALAAMARALGKKTEESHWLERAESLRKLILDRLYVPGDAAFYDLDAENNFVKVRSIVIARVCGEHVVDQATFDTLWDRQLGNPHAFWAPYPLPSSALDDLTFVRPISRNSWGGPSQALTALRAGRWMDHYGRSAEFAHMMQQWCEALIRDPSFRQQMDPLNGEFTQGGASSYSPAALVLYDYTWRLAGIREAPGQLHWNARPASAASNNAVFRLHIRGSRVAEMHYAGNRVTLILDGRNLGEIEGCARLVTDRAGLLLYVLGVDRTPQRVTLRLADAPHRPLLLRPNARVNLA
jgi:hypothetical protein